MAQRKYLYEVLIRGSKDGEISGAHQIWATSFTDDDTGREIAVTHENAAVLNLDDIKGLIDANFVGVSNQIASLQADRAALIRDLEDSRSREGELQVKIIEAEAAARAAEKA